MLCNLGWFGVIDFLKKDLFFIIFNSVYMCGSMKVTAGAQEASGVGFTEAEVLDSCGLLDKSVGNELGSSGRTAHALHP